MLHATDEPGEASEGEGADREAEEGSPRHGFRPAERVADESSGNQENERQKAA